MNRLNSHILRKKLGNCKNSIVSEPRIQQILTKYFAKKSMKVGLVGQETTEDYYIDTDRLTPDEINDIASHYSAFIAKVALELLNTDITLRFAIHYKESCKDMKFLCTVLESLQLRPLFIKIYSDRTAKILGDFCPNDQFVFVHDFTSSGRTPMLCIREMRNSNLKVRKFTTFFSRLSTETNDLESRLADMDIGFQYYCHEGNHGQILFKEHEAR